MIAGGSSEESSYEQARFLAANLASLWNGGAEILDRLGEDYPAGPWEALERLGPEGLDRFLDEAGNREDLDRAYRELRRYLAAETWFDRAAAEDNGLQTFREAPVAYFSAEFGLASWLPIYSGGLGVLAADVLKEASDMGLPMVGVGLLYRHGFFSQKLDDSDYQTEIPADLDPETLPLEPVAGHDGGELLISIPLAERMIAARVWKATVGRVPLYLLDTSVEDNSPEDRAITDRLYLGDQAVRISQEIVLGIGGVRMLQALGIQPSVYSMNEGHSAFLGVEILSDRMHRSTLDAALPRVRSQVVYTNHTVVPAGNDIFPRDLLVGYLGPYARQSGIGVERLMSLGAPTGDSGFSMAILAFQLSGKANAVSRLHAQIIPREWPGFAVEAVTNGVHVPTWVGPTVRDLLARHITDWRSDKPSWDRIDEIPDEELQWARDRQRATMIDFVNSTQEIQLDPQALTIVWARRFAEYKRASLIASDLGRLSHLMSDDARPVQLVISGKSHPDDEGGKRMLQDLLRMRHQDAVISRHVAFVEDYNLGIARCLAAGADVWLNTPRKPFEASGTSGMKSSDNGGIQLTVMDGWAAEVDWWGIGWGIPGENDSADAGRLYEYLEDGIIPTFYRRDESGLPRDWLAMVKRTMILTLSRYSTRRMLHEYLDKLYLPLIAEAHEVPATA